MPKMKKPIIDFERIASKTDNGCLLGKGQEYMMQGRIDSCCSKFQVHY